MKYISIQEIQRVMPSWLAKTKNTIGRSGPNSRRRYNVNRVESPFTEQVILMMANCQPVAVNPDYAYNVWLAATRRSPFRLVGMQWTAGQIGNREITVPDFWAWQVNRELEKIHHQQEE